MGYGFGKSGRYAAAMTDEQLERFVAACARWEARVRGWHAKFDAWEAYRATKWWGWLLP